MVTGNRKFFVLIFKILFSIYTSHETALLSIVVLLYFLSSTAHYWCLRFFGKIKHDVFAEEDDANSDAEAEVSGVTRVLTSANSQPTFGLVAGLLLDAAYQDLNAICTTLSATPG